MKVWIEMY